MSTAEIIALALKLIGHGRDILEIIQRCEEEGRDLTPEELDVVDIRREAASNRLRELMDDE
jgi:hypothetical protein